MLWKSGRTECLSSIVWLSLENERSFQVESILCWAENSTFDSTLFSRRSWSSSLLRASRHWFRLLWPLQWNDYILIAWCGRQMFQVWWENIPMYGWRGGHIAGNAIIVARIQYYIDINWNCMEQIVGWIARHRSNYLSNTLFTNAAQSNHSTTSVRW